MIYCMGHELMQEPRKFLKTLSYYAINNDSSGGEGDSLAAPTAFEKVASMGLAGVLAITVAEAIFWAAGMPLAEIWYKVTTGIEKFGILE